MFEKSVEAFWFGSTPQLLAKRATTNSTDPLEKVPHIFRTLFLDGEPSIMETAPAADPLDQIRERALLKMYGAQPLADELRASDYLRKMLDSDDLRKVAALPGRVTLPVNTDEDDELLEKDARSRQLNALEQYVLRKLKAGETLESLIAFAKSNGHEGVAAQYRAIGERLLEAGLIAA